MQTMQRALKLVDSNSSNHDGFHYLEAMACPYGCVNGGGSVPRSIPTSTTAPMTTFHATMIRETPTEIQSRVQETLNHLDIPDLQDPTCTLQQKPTRTRYHVVPPMQYTMGATAGVQVDKIQW
jgi:iron only hydrogenase large subunit-like protein